MNKYALVTLLLVAPSLLIFTSCAKKPGSDSSDQASTAEPSYCSTITPYENSIIVNGSATYKYRPLTATGLGSVSTTEAAIKHAEIIVYDAEGNVVQCSETNDSGAFSFAVNKVDGAFRVRVTTRADNNYVKVSVLNAPAYNQYYFIEKTFNVVSSVSSVAIGNLSAPAASNSSLEGGAFNIFAQIENTNAILRTKTAQCASYGCTQFTVASKINVYWAKGFNPANYYNITDPLSFYDPDKGALFILGGDAGDVDNEDTDHFDNSVILHEYGHILEHQFTNHADSPGGTHNGNSIIDARLAWGEGFADFFQAFITGSGEYVDTIGNVDGTLSTKFNIKNNIDTNVATGGYRQLDVTTTAGEGIFREFAVARVLWDLFKPTGTINAAALWATLTKTSNGFKSSSTAYRDMGLFLQYLIANDSSNSATINSILNSEYMWNDRRGYGLLLSTGSCSTTRQLVGTTIADGGSTNQFKSNGFHMIYHSGGAITVKMTYTLVNAASPTDLDLFLRSEGYVFGESTGLVGKSDKGYGSEESGSETITTTLDPGYYMINVQAYIGDAGIVGSGANYQLQLNGVRLCP